MNNTETERSPRQIAEQIIDEHLDEMMSPREYASTCKALIDGVEKALRDRDGRVWRDAAQRLRDKADEWRQQADRWQRNAQSAGMDIIRDQDYADRDVCLSKMSAAVTLAIEFDEIASATRGKS
jgi:translation initiation factor 2B subunit (eIF-2B alpha/beta/delta family)